STPLFENLADGNYFVYVKDAEDCIANSQFAIEPGIILDFVSGSTQANCGASDGTITIDVLSGTPPYLYSIDNINFQSSNVFEDLIEGAYTIYVRDGADCESDRMTTVDGSTEIIFEVIEDAASCATSNGRLEVIVTTGMGPFLYSLNGGAFQSSPIFTEVMAGDYIITIEDINGCRDSNEGLLNDLGDVSLEVSITQGKCGEQNGSINIIPINGTAPFTYSLDGVNFQTLSTFENLAPNTYTAYIKDANDCLAFNDNLLIEASSDIEARIESRNISCFGEMDGRVAIQIINGKAPFQTSLNGSDFQTTLVYENLGKETYEITVKDADDCTTSFTFSIAEPDELQATITFDENKLTANVTGGTMPYRFAWSNGATTPSIEVAMDTTYAVTVIDANECQVTTSFEVITSLNDPLLASKVKVFPNPTDEVLNITLEEIGLIQEIEIFNIQGKRILQSKMDAKEIRIDISNFHAGNYILRMTGDGLLTKRVLVY
ncbi:MAG: T9SS type A sorting domain-containing protein, partial [Bacteroidota bacterium]